MGYYKNTYIISKSNNNVLCTLENTKTSELKKRQQQHDKASCFFGRVYKVLHSHVFVYRDSCVHNGNNVKSGEKWNILHSLWEKWTASS